jgi:plastocyanin
MLKKAILGLCIGGLALSANAGTLSGKVTAASGKSVVYVEAVQGKTFPAPQGTPVMDQHSLQFQPHVLVVPVGTTVEFLNSDKVAHNVFWPSISGNKKLGHNMGTWPTGEKRPFKFDNPGVVTLLCNVHPDMAGYIVVTPTPYFAETDASGNYKIENVPDGQYNVTAWHEGAKPQTKSIAIAGEGKADFALSK